MTLRYLAFFGFVTIFAGPAHGQGVASSYTPPKVIPYSHLVCRAAGAPDPDIPVIKKKKDPNAPVNPPLLAALRNMEAKEAPVARYKAELAAYDAANSYASSMASTAAALAPTYTLPNGDRVASTGLTVPTHPVPPDSRLLDAADEAERQYLEAYEKYGDPSGRLPLPDNYTVDTRPLFSFREIGLTPDDRVMVISTGGTNRDIPARLWLVDANQARVVLERGSEVKRDGRPFAKLDSFKSVGADNSGRALLLASLKNAGGLPSPAAPVLLLWTEKTGAQLVVFQGGDLEGVEGGCQMGGLEHAKFVLSPAGDVAIYCFNAPFKTGRGTTSVLLDWTGGKLKVAAFMRPIPAGYMSPNSFVVGGKEIKCDPNNGPIDLSEFLWMPDGNLGVFHAEKKVANGMYHITGRVWEYDPGSADVLSLEAGDVLNHSWFGPDHAVAILDGSEVPGENNKIKFIPTVLRAGVGAPPAVLFDLAKSKLPGMGPEQRFSQMAPVMALGPNHQIAFLAYLTGGADSVNGNTALEQPFNPHGPHLSDQFVLITGTIGEPGSLRIVADELTFAGTADGHDVACGPFPNLVYLNDGRLVFSTTGLPTERSRYGRYAVDTHIEPGYWSSFVWSLEPAGIKALASRFDPAPPTAKHGAELGGFWFRPAADGRVIMTRSANDAVFVVNDRK